MSKNATDKDKPVLRPYWAVISSPLLAQKSGQRFKVMAINRSEAVYDASQTFWDEYKNTLGPIKGAMLVDNPYNEVAYTEEMLCTDRLYKLLPANVIDKVVKESGGKIVRDDNPNSPNCLKRLKRRRDIGKFIAPNIRLMANGVMFYRIVKVAQKTEGGKIGCKSKGSHGKIVQKRKYTDVRLKARNLEEAVIEIAAKKLNQKSLAVARLKKKTRLIKVLKSIVRSMELSRLPKRKPKQKVSAPVVTSLSLTEAAKALLKKKPTGSSVWANSRSELEGWGIKGPHKVIPKETLTAKSNSFEVL